MSGVLLNGDGSWPWSAMIEGDDILVEGLATAFGGDDDPEDDGQTASGVSTSDNPEIMACALPMRVDELDALSGSPIPRMPFGLHPDGRRNPLGAWVAVEFIDTAQDSAAAPPTQGLRAPLIVPVIDLGPGKRTGHVIDLTVAAARLRASDATADNFEAPVRYRIIGGAKYITS